MKRILRKIILWLDALEQKPRELSHSLMNRVKTLARIALRRRGGRMSVASCGLSTEPFRTKAFFIFQIARDRDIPNLHLYTCYQLLKLSLQNRYPIRFWYCFGLLCRRLCYNSVTRWSRQGSEKLDQFDSLVTKTLLENAVAPIVLLKTCLLLKAVPLLVHKQASPFPKRSKILYSWWKMRLVAETSQVGWLPVKL